MTLWDAIREHGLPLHITLEGDFMYPKPPQGDANFILPTAFVRRRGTTELINLKEQKHVEAALKAYREQDAQEEFPVFVAAIQSVRTPTPVPAMRR